MPKIKPYLCAKCGESNPDNFFHVTRGDKVTCYNKSLCKEHVREYNNSYYAATRSRRSSKRMERTYGVTSDEYDAQLERQDGRCAACGITREEDIENRGRRWPVDHDHETDEVRGILCWLCNLALGAVKDNPDTLRSLANYVEQRGVW